MPTGRVDTSRFWEQVLLIVEEGRVIPVIGPDLLLVPEGDSQTLLYQMLAGRLAQYLELPDGESPAGQSLNTVAYRYLAQGGDSFDAAFSRLTSSRNRCAGTLSVEGITYLHRNAG